MTSLAVAQMPQQVNSQAPQNFAGWGLYIAEGTTTYGRDGGDILMMMNYSHRISKTVEVEFGLQYLPVMRLFERNSRILRDSIPYISLSWLGDISFMIQPFDGILQRFRIGIGPTLTTHTVMIKVNPNGNIAPGIIDSNGVQIIPNAVVPASYANTRLTRGIGIGANLKIDYLVPIAPNIDICFRAQVQLFRASDMRQNAQSGTATDGGLGSLGAFIRVGW
jgi:hypothetical protein